MAVSSAGIALLASYLHALTYAPYPPLSLFVIADVVVWTTLAVVLLTGLFALVNRIVRGKELVQLPDSAVGASAYALIPIYGLIVLTNRPGREHFFNPWGFVLFLTVLLIGLMITLSRRPPWVISGIFLTLVGAITCLARLSGFSFFVIAVLGLTSLVWLWRGLRRPPSLRSGLLRSLLSLTVALWIVAAVFALATLATSYRTGALLAALAVIALPTLQNKLGSRLPDLVSRTSDTRRLVPGDRTLMLFSFSYLLLAAQQSLMDHWVELSGSSVPAASTANTYMGEFVVLGIPAILTAFVPLWLQRTAVPGEGGEMVTPAGPA